ncbi:MAG: hypothetical protein ACLFVY_04140 [Phycisphaerae bacterium]
MPRTLIFESVEDAVHAFEWINDAGQTVQAKQTIAAASVSEKGRLTTPGMRPRAWSLDVRQPDPVETVDIRIRTSATVHPTGY